jgi:hypothetical protein
MRRARSPQEKATRLGWLGAAIQIGGVSFHLVWHSLGVADPASALAHYLLLHLPQHLGVVILLTAAGWLLMRADMSLPLGLLLLGVVAQAVGLVVDVLAVNGVASHSVAAALLASGGLMALAAAALPRALRGLPPQDASGPRGTAARRPRGRSAAPRRSR